MAARKPTQPTKPLATKRRADSLAQHNHWLQRAAAVAHLPVSQGGSPHPSVQVGAVLVSPQGKEIASAANRFATGVNRRRPERYLSGHKSLWINCAEQIAIASAAKRRAKLAGATLYVTLEPCAVCAGQIAELGIKQVCVPVGSLRRYAKLKAKWKHSIEVGIIKLAEAGIPLIRIDVEEKGKL